jgi:hypothetical protein
MRHLLAALGDTEVVGPVAPSGVRLGPFREEAAHVAMARIAAAGWAASATPVKAAHDAALRR